MVHIWQYGCSSAGVYNLGSLTVYKIGSITSNTPDDVYNDGGTCVSYGDIGHVTGSCRP